MTKLSNCRNQMKIKITMNFYTMQCELPLFKNKIIIFLYEQSEFLCITATTKVHLKIYQTKIFMEEKHCQSLKLSSGNLVAVGEVETHLSQIVWHLLIFSECEGPPLFWGKCRSGKNS